MTKKATAFYLALFLVMGAGCNMFNSDKSETHYEDPTGNEEPGDDPFIKIVADFTGCDFEEERYYYTFTPRIRNGSGVNVDIDMDFGDGTSVTVGNSLSYPKTYTSCGPFLIRATATLSDGTQVYGDASVSPCLACTEPTFLPFGD